MRVNMNQDFALRGIVERLQRRSDLLWATLVVIGTLALSAAAGLQTMRLEDKFVRIGLVGVPFAFIVGLSIELGVLGLLGMGATFYAAYELPHFLGFSAVELGVHALIGLVIARAWLDKNKYGLVKTPLDKFLLLFIGFSLLSLFNAVYNLKTVQEPRNLVIRTVLAYGVFFVVTNLIRTRRQLTTLLSGMLAMAGVIASLMVAQQVVGSTIAILPGRGHIWESTTLGQELGADRIFLPGSALSFVMLYPALSLLINPELGRRIRPFLLILVILFLLAIAFTFTRGLWIGAIVAISLYMLIGREQRKSLILFLVCLVILYVIAIPLLSAYFPRTDAIVDAVWFRFSSLFAGDELEYDSSTQYRLQENKLAQAKIAEYPLLGIGAGAKYRDPWYDGEPETLQGYVHNSYLYLLTDFGFLGFLPFVAFAVVAVVRGLLYWPLMQDPILKSLVISFTLSFIAVLVCSISSPRLLEMQYVLMIGISLGLREVAIRLDKGIESKASRLALPV